MGSTALAAIKAAAEREREREREREGGMGKVRGNE